MNRVEMTEIFSVLMLAYPNAEMFRAEDTEGLKLKLAPIITLWTTCMKDVDFWTAQQAVVKVCKTCKFPPTIAEMREAAEDVLKDVHNETDRAYLEARSALSLRGGDLEAAYKELPTRSRRVIDAMGGMEVFAPPDKEMLNMHGFKATYERLLRSNPVGLPGGDRKQINR